MTGRRIEVFSDKTISHTDIDSVPTEMISGNYYTHEISQKKEFSLLLLMQQELTFFVIEKVEKDNI